DLENFDYNLAIIKLRKLYESFSQEEKDISKEDLEKFLKMLAPFAPHISEELWEKIGNNKNKKNFISKEEWPEADETKIDERLEKKEQAIEKITDDINNIVKLIQEKQPEKEKPSKAIIYTIPPEKENYSSSIEKIKKKTHLEEVEVYAINDEAIKSNPEKTDPEGKAKKAKPGKPAIYLE
ncbi:MAG TPA: class I tRNA ligase family protein, partial [Candidatus Nanoarchaeia archaeon]|nr:class I tRNA ligase family protein [Candidatus Nanoarchaeia archaeon]